MIVKLAEGKIEVNPSTVTCAKTPETVSFPVTLPNSAGLRKSATDAALRKPDSSLFKSVTLIGVYCPLRALPEELGFILKGVVITVTAHQGGLLASSLLMAAANSR